jgi:Methyltransferase domain
MVPSFPSMPRCGRRIQLNETSARVSMLQPLGDGRMISSAIGNYDDPASIGSKFRRRRSAPLAELIDKVVAAKGSCTILDLGGTERYWNILGAEFLASRNCEVVLLNQRAAMARRTGPFRHLQGDACAVDAADGAFDIVHSNSVIEHVGRWSRTQAFAAEARRLAPNYFVQTPNFWFPWEPHFGVPFFQMLAAPIQVSLLMRRGRGFFPRCATVASAVECAESVRLLDVRMLSALFPDARIIRERFLGMTKSFIALRERASAD